MKNDISQSKAYSTLAAFCNRDRTQMERCGSKLSRGKFDAKVRLVKKFEGVGFVVEDPSGQATRLDELNKDVGVRTQFFPFKLKFEAGRILLWNTTWSYL